MHRPRREIQPGAFAADAHACSDRRYHLPHQPKAAAPSPPPISRLLAGVAEMSGRSRSVCERTCPVAFDAPTSPYVNVRDTAAASASVTAKYLAAAAAKICPTLSTCTRGCFRCSISLISSHLTIVTYQSRFHTTCEGTSNSSNVTIAKLASRGASAVRLSTFSNALEHTQWHQPLPPPHMAFVALGLLQTKNAKTLGLYADAH